MDKLTIINQEFRIKLLNKILLQMITMLPPHPEEISIARNTLSTCQETVPPDIREKLNLRNTLEKHPVNCIKYYPLPLKINQETLNQMRVWGICYGDLLEKITCSYFNEPDGYVRQFLDSSLFAYLPEWLKAIIVEYKTCNHLAGAHLGDDNFNGRSIEWNLGAVGGLEEGSGTEEEIAKEINYHPLQDTESIDAVLAAIRYAYEAHCRANRIAPKTNPCIAYIEHDDIYYSSVRIVRKLGKLGVNIHYTFHHALTFEDNHLKTKNGEIIDIIYLDCHLEDLHATHPVIQAVRNNRVALDSSPFARLILRSKVVMALLSTQECHTALELDKQSVQMIRRNMSHSVLMNQYTPLDGDFDPLKQKVVKIAIGSVFGGNGVMVFPPEVTREEIIKNFKPLKRLLSYLAREYCPVSCADIASLTMQVETRALFTEILKTSCISSSSPLVNRTKGIKQIQENIYNSLNQMIQEHENRYGHLCCTDLENIIRQTFFSFLDKNTVNGKLLERLMTLYHKFFMVKLISQNIPVVVQDFIEPEMLYIQPQRLNIKLEIQDGVKTGMTFALLSENEDQDMNKELFISHRIHLLFTEKGKEIFVSGSQVFPITRGKQDNRYKMTCALLHH